MHASSSTTRPPEPQAVPRIDPVTLRTSIARGRRVRVVDVRGVADVERSGSRIPGATEIPIHQLFVRRDELPARSEKIVVIAHEPIRACAAALTLSLLGYPNVRVLEGGFDAWTAAHLPLSSTAA